MNNQSSSSILFGVQPNQTNNNEQHQELSEQTAHLTSLVLSILTIVPVQLIIIVIAVGNGMVILAVIYDLKLRRQHHNWLIVSLAVADFLVGITVMPFSLVYQVRGVWIFGWVWCELWLALDVQFVTASIINLCLISIDRLCSIVYPIRYLQIRSKRFITIMILLAWLTAFLISFPPLVGWRPVRTPGSCELSDDTGYVLYSAFGSFYIPFIVLMVVNTKIFIVARERLRQRQYTSATQTMLLLSTQHMLKTCDAMTISSSDSDSRRTSRRGSLLVLWPRVGLKVLSPEMFRKKSTNDKQGSRQSAPPANPAQKTVADQMQKHKKREMRATMILGVILLTFLGCWLPFFVVYLLSGFGVKIEKMIFAVFFWLGYVNSALNPPIYTLCNPEFRRGFKKLCCRHRKKSSTMIRLSTTRDRSTVLFERKNTLMMSFSSRLRRKPARCNQDGMIFENESLRPNGVAGSRREKRVEPISSE